MIKYRQATKEDAIYFSKNMRDIEKEELMATYSKQIISILEHSILFSDECYVAFEESPIFIFGVCGGIGEGKPWIISTNEIFKYKKELILKSKMIIESWIGTYGFLWNIANTKNRAALRYINMLGFDVVYMFKGVGNVELAEFHLTSGERNAQ